MSADGSETSPRLLGLLLRTGRAVSGQEIADELAVSRTAVWKAAARLREEGLAVSAERGRGYRLIEPPQGLSASLIAARLETAWLGRPVHYRQSLDSTNRLAKELAARGTAPGTLVITDLQTAGRGRMDRVWESPAGANLMMSLVLRPRLAIQAFFRLTMATGVALSRAVDRTAGLETKLKWPNDLYINGAKASGILTEISGQAQGLDWAVVGIGLNVNAAPDLATATCLAREAGRKIDRLELLLIFLAELEALLDQGPDPEEIRRAWLDRSFTIGKRVKVLDRGREVSGLAVDIDRDGALMLETEQEGLIRVVCGDIETG